MKEVTIGNAYHSEIRKQNNGLPETGYDIKIMEETGSIYYYQLRRIKKDCITSIPPVGFMNERNITWEKLNKNVKKQHFYQLFPSGTEHECNLFVYGPIEGKLENERLDWARSHLVYSIDITLQLESKIGRFQEVTFHGRVKYDYQYLINQKWFVTVHKCVGGATYYIQEYAKDHLQQKEFGKKAKMLSNAANVPWEIAAMVATLPKEEALSILRLIKEAKGTATPYQSAELLCGIKRRSVALRQILGDDLFHKLSCTGQKRTKALAEYLNNKT